VESGVLSQEGVAERGDQGRTVAAAAEVPVGDGAGVVHHSLHVPARGQVVERAVGRRGQPRRRHVEEPVEVDAQRTVQRAPEELGRRAPHEGLMEGVGGREGVVHRVPVTEVVLGVEADDAQRRGVGEGPADLFRRRAHGDGVEHGADDRVRIVVEQGPRQAGHVGEAAGAGPPLVEGGLEPVLRRRQQSGEVVRMAPLRRLLAAIGGAGLRHQRAEHPSGVGLVDERQRLERLVGEVESVTFVDEDVVGDGGEHHRLDVGARHTRDGRGEGALGGVGRAGVDESAVPDGQALGRERLRRQRRLGKAGRVAAGVAAHEGEGVHESEGAVVGVQVGQHVGHRREHGESRPPTLGAVGGAVLDGRGHDAGAGGIEVEQTQRRLGGDERDAVLEAVGEPAPQATFGVRNGATADPHVTVVHGHVEGGGVVGPRVQGAAGVEVEPGVVPVTGEEAGFDRALVQWEAHVRAPVLDGPGAALVPDHDHGQGAHLREQAALPLQFVDRPGPHSLVHRHSISRRPLLAYSAGPAIRSSGFLPKSATVTTWRI
jgi:hypothetical protein